MATDAVTATQEMAQRLADLVRVETTTCSACGAQPGQRCRSVGGVARRPLDQPHVGRGTNADAAASGA